MSYNIPILFIIFNRPHLVQEIFNVIKQQKPKYLYIASDGARPQKEGEVEKVRKSRDIINQIDWDCEVKTFFREENVGPGKGVSSAVVWFFEHVEQGIILEEDCLPHIDFFPYCEELLNKYMESNTVMLIGGNNFQQEIKYGESSYYFSAYPFIWGWAGWRRTLNGYDYNLDNISFPEFKKIIEKYFSSWTERQVWIDRYILLKEHIVDTWDYQLIFNIWKNNGLAIVPKVNLVSNIGFSKDAVHCKDVNHKCANVKTSGIMPLRHPDMVEQNLEADSSYYKYHFHKSTIRILYRGVRRFLILNFKK